MIAAIYCRKSTNQNLPDEEKSVTRQVERARAYAARKGWTVADAHVYVDDGISGAEFLKRPGFLRLMNALKPARPPFQVLIMSEESRLGREAIETSYALKQLIDAGVRVFTYLDDRERTLGSALDKVMLSLTNFASEMEREKGRQRTRDAMQRKAARGHVAGGKVAPRIYYVCHGWRVDGTCRNAWSLPLPDLDAAVVAALREDVLTPDLVDDVTARAVELWGEQHAGLDARRRGLEGELRRVERELGRFTEAIASGEAPPTILEAMRARERRRGDLTAQLEHVDGLERTARPTMTAALRADLRGRLESWDALLRSNPIEARPVLRQLLVGRLVCTPRQLITSDL
jgi:DNA invertase Pin-like site-specific DNA recombinase